MLVGNAETAELLLTTVDFRPARHSGVNCDRFPEANFWFLCFPYLSFWIAVIARNAGLCS
jgi:hypothetical protein